MTYTLSLSIVMLVYFIVYLTLHKRSRKKHSELSNEKDQTRDSDSRSDRDEHRTNDTQGDAHTNRDKTRGALEEEGASRPEERKRKLSIPGGLSANRLYASKSCTNLSCMDSEPAFHGDRQQAYTSRYNSI